MAEAAQAVRTIDAATVSQPQVQESKPTARQRNLSFYESPNELGTDHRIGQIAAVRWLDDDGRPQWYIVVVVGQTPTGYEVRWKNDIYKVDLMRDECLFNYNQRAYAFFQRYPQATSITIGNDVYLFAFPDESIVSCVDAVNLIRAQRAQQSVQVQGVGPDMTIEQVAALVPDNKIIFV